ncbi:MAG: hypothetical protein WCD04_01065 [Terriglobia bacterium]|jgi:hypothetical protein
MTARDAHLTDTQVQGAVAALDAILDATRYLSASKQICGGEEIEVSTWKGLASPTGFEPALPP